MKTGRPLFLSLAIWLLASGAFAQIHNPGISKFQETEFAFEVKTIDEFIERFNNDKFTLIRKYMDSNFPGKKINRLDLLRTLFNYQESLWSEADALEFSKTVLDEKSEKFLDFYSDKWYAEADCRVNYKGMTKRVRITLQVFVSDRTGAAKWVVCGARAPFLDFSRREDPKKFLNPISHATDFIGLKKAMEDKAYIRNYLSDGFRESHLNKYLAAVATGDIVFEQIESITYHFLSIPEWLFTVKEFRRKGKNTGWLIQSLSRRSDAEKQDYIKNTLHCDQ
jgi:hypothetical protein